MTNHAASRPYSDTAITTVEALLQAYAKGQRSFSNIHLPQCDLQGQNLKGADFSYADLSGANLSQANLRGVDLSYAVLRGCTLHQANLRGAMVIGTDLQDIDLTLTTLQEADYDPQKTRFPKGFDPVKAGMKSDRT